MLLLLLLQVHVPTLSVFANWPTNKTPISYLYDVTFSPNSGMSVCWLCAMRSTCSTMLTW